MKTVKTQKGTELPLIQLKGKDYLEVKYRIAWFREEHPLGKFATECLVRTDKFVIYKAFISVPTSNGEYVVLADGVKREDYAHFSDAEEKASTGAIGRALALLGYGTVNATELEEGERIVDAPVEPKTALDLANEKGKDLQSALKQDQQAAKPKSKLVEQMDNMINKKQKPVCSCGEAMILSKKKDWVYCPHYKEPGSHSTPIKYSEVDHG